ncbi:hypothetical protein [Chachezhania sediminis]|uniref:hypothetical protein n=1 Tax=Chachezhania sediminis TaxID=2599291 RepID=UPI00131A6D6D|nr:hypothetical protein [Chachezhania sediminis]
MQDGSRPADLTAAARNLLVDCAGLGAGDPLVVCVEAAEHGWYDDAVADAVAQAAADMGMSVRQCVAGPPEADQPAEVEALLASDSNIVFFARVGDQGRFDGHVGGRRVMVYARNAADLGSAFGQVPHTAMQGFKAAVNRVLFGAAEIRITCPNGTDITGHPPRGTELEEATDVTTRRFPLGVPAPVPADGFRGQVALTGSLTPTGNRHYDPASLALDGTVMAQLDGGRITGFDGTADQVARICAHYAHVANLFGLEPFAVHSWHAGIHPGAPFFDPAGQDPDYWSNNVFCSPRLLHFHTCGTSAPGEIAWNLIDASVHVDGEPLWLDGRMRPQAFAPLAECLAREPELAALF